ncbi:MAG: hypothetical protein AB7S26_24435 [Sandaracinaceae bacterium]
MRARARALRRWSVCAATLAFAAAPASAQTRGASAADPIQEEPTSDEPRSDGAVAASVDGARARGPEVVEDRPLVPPAPSDDAAPDVRLTASPIDGVRLVVPGLDDFTVDAHIALWARFTLDASPTTDAQPYFEVPLARPGLNVSAFHGMLRASVLAELAGTPRLLDLFVDFVPHAAFRLRLGQWRTPFSRTFLTPLVQLAMEDRGFVSDTFRADRDTGLMAFGTVGTAFEYDVGVFNGSGVNGRLGDTPVPMVMARVALTPYGSVPLDQTPALTVASPSGLQIGAGAYYRERNLAAQGEPMMIQSTGSGGVDIGLVEGPFSFFAEGFLRAQRVDAADWIGSWAAFAQASVFVVPQILELAARGSWWDPDIDAGANLVHAYEAGVKGFFYLDDVAYGQHIALGIQYRYMRDPTLALTFAPETHRAVAQLQIWM